MPNKNSTAEKSKTLNLSKPTVKETKKDEGECDGILRIKCPVCSKFFRYRRGREKNPDLKKLDKYMKKAQCPFCGQPLRFSVK